MKNELPRLGFELESSCPFPRRITISTPAPLLRILSQHDNVMLVQLLMSITYYIAFVAFVYRKWWNYVEYGVYLLLNF